MTIHEDERLANFRLAVLEMIRVTEQCATMAHYASGRGLRFKGDKGQGSIGETQFRRTMRRAFLSCLDHSLCQKLRLSHPDPKWWGYREPEGRSGSADPWEVAPPFGEDKGDWNKRKSEFGGVLWPGMPAIAAGHRELELLISPVDGVEHLLSGYHGGSMSLVAGAPVGSFPAGGQALEVPMGYMRRYFVIVTHEKRLADRCHELLSGSKGKGGVPVDEVEGIGVLFRDELPKWYEQREDGGQRPKAGQYRNAMAPTVATVSPDMKYGFSQHLGHGFPVRQFHGSPVAAALTVLLRQYGTDMFTGVVRETAALQIAIAAKVTRGHVLALELSPPSPVAGREVGGASEGAGRGPERRLLCPDPTRVLRERDLVNTDDVFLVATGITSHPLLHGVKVQPDGTVTTHSLALNGRTRSVRFVTSQQDLEYGKFAPLDGVGLKPAHEVVTEFRKAISKKVPVRKRVGKTVEVDLYSTLPKPAGGENAAGVPRPTAATDGTQA